MEGYPGPSLHRLSCILATALLLSACGGGSTYNTPATSQASPSTNPTPSPVQPPAPISYYAKVQLTWIASTAPDIGGYYVYHGTASGNYPDKLWVSNVTSYDYKVLAKGDHYFTITAIDYYGNESQKPDEIHVTVP